MNPTIVLSLTCKTTLEHRARTKYLGSYILHLGKEPQNLRNLIGACPALTLNGVNGTTEGANWLTVAL